MTAAKVTILGSLFGAFILTLTKRNEISIVINDTIKRVTARGIRNNNPGNIRITNIQWRGKVPVANNTDGAFEQFFEAVNGIRAMVRDLRTGARRGEDTVTEIINQWAPAVENNTRAYIASVATRIDVDPDQEFDINEKMPDLLKAIITHENGEQPYSDELIREAIAAA